MSVERAFTDEQIWQGDRHLSELALTAAADGELDLLPAEAQQHLDDCPACQDRLGEAVLLATAAGEAMRAAGPAADAALAPAAPASGRRHRPLPRAAMAVALALAALGAGPALGEAALGLPRAAAWATGSLPVVLRAGRLVARGVLSGSNPTLLVASWAAALVLIVMGLALARLWSQPTGEVA